MDGEALERLVLDAQRGDPWAFGRIFDEFHEPIYRFIANRVRRPIDAEDLTQLVFERIHQIDDRVLEVERATRSGDQNAVKAAISAYGDAVQSAVAEAGANPDRLAHLKAALGLHVVVLETLATEVPSPAVGAIDGAIASSRHEVEKMSGAHTEPGNFGSGGATGPTGASGSDAPGTTPDAGPTASATRRDRSARPSDQPESGFTPTPRRSFGH